MSARPVGAFHSEGLTQVVPGVYRTKPYGYLDGFRVHACGLQPNMDASKSYTLHVVLVDPDGNTVPVVVTQISESVTA